MKPSTFLLLLLFLMLLIHFVMGCLFLPLHDSLEEEEERRRKKGFMKETVGSSFFGKLEVVIRGL